MHSSPRTHDSEVYSVSRLNREVRTLLETSLDLIWVEGELSNLARPASGHVYFTLKDGTAQVRCAMFRMRRRNLRFEPTNGMQARVRARVSLYETRGEFQLIVEHMEEAGDGALRRRFEALKKKLFEEGLFDAARKKSLPSLPHRIAVVTSPSGAAIRDILSVLQRRFPAIEVVIYPTLVQGEGAAIDIAAAVQAAAARGDCEVLLITRGGGSFEDLNAYNDENLARTIAACPLPVVTGIGHEIDFTIADFAADRRAPTPSAAAELLSPDRNELEQVLSRQAERLRLRFGSLLEHQGNRLDWLCQRLRTQHPGRRLRELEQRLDELELRVRNAHSNQLRHRATELAEVTARLHQHSPAARVATLRARLDSVTPRLGGTMHGVLARERQRLQGLRRALHAVSPLATLGRGYSIVSRDDDGRIVRHATDVSDGERIVARLASGRLYCTVQKTEIEE